MRFDVFQVAEVAFKGEAIYSAIDGRCRTVFDGRRKFVLNYKIDEEFPKLYGASKCPAVPMIKEDKYVLKCHYANVPANYKMIIRLIM